MLTFFIWLLTAALILDCLFLILLVLVQLPKKEAGAGLAFGGAATDALFGAGSGNVLTKITKWAAVIFFVVAIALAVAQGKAHKRRTMLTNLPVPTETALPATPVQPTTTTVTTTTTSAPTSGEKLSGLLSTNVSSLLSTNVSTNVSAPLK